MKHLPDLLRRAPNIIYISAFILTIASIALSYWEIVLINNAYADPENNMVRFSLFKGLYSAVLDGIYLVASGMLVHIGIYIWDKMPANFGEAQ